MPSFSLNIPRRLGWHPASILWMRTGYLLLARSRNVGSAPIIRKDAYIKNFGNGKFQELRLMEISRIEPLTS